jgi:lipopolysaccharide export system protein LptA
MRVGRWLILAAIIAIIVFVGDTYFRHKAGLDALAAPRSLDLNLDASGDRWRYHSADGAKETFEISATNFREVKDPLHMELDGVQLKLYHKEDKEYDLIETDKAEFDPNTKNLYSDSPVTITMGVAAEGLPQRGRLLKIHTSGVHFDKDSGRATTDRAAEFEFDQGTGSATGAEYDPDTRQLHLRNKAILDWRGKTAAAKPMHIEAAEAYYLERESKVVLMQWSKLAREDLKMDAGMSTILMEHNDIKRVDAQNGRGVQDKDGRTVDFAADHLGLDFGEHMTINHIEGTDHAKLISTSPSGRTTATGNRLDLTFDISNGESTLAGAVTTGDSVAESDPVVAPGSSAETRILRSETIRMKMQPGGKDIASAETDGAATLDFLPTRPDQPKRVLTGDKVWITYGAQNRMELFRSTNVTTRTEKPPTPKQPAPPPAITSSKDILATFDPKTGELARVEQKTNFRYQEGDREARADMATLEQQKDVMTLDGAARLADPTGSTTADRIVIDQKSGDFTADGNVASTRQPDKDGKSSAMLSTEDVMEARAQRMVSTGHGKDQKIHYEGKANSQAMAWQGANRVVADKLDIDRQHHILEAHGNVTSQFVDKAKVDNAKNDKAKAGDGKDGKTAANSKQTAPVFTVVKAPDLVYSDETRLAYYQGGVELHRLPDMTVTSRELKAYLNDADSNSSLNKAVADGAVKVVNHQTASPGKPARTRTSTSEHMEYYADDGKVLIDGAKPLLVDSIKGKTTGEQLIWFANDDNLIVYGGESAPAQSTIRKKK